jgi:hypothetical protein
MSDLYTLADAEDTIMQLRAENATLRARVVEVETERDRAIEDAIYNAQYVDLVSKYRAEAAALRAEVERLKFTGGGGGGTGC